LPASRKPGIRNPLGSSTAYLEANASLPPMMAQCTKMNRVVRRLSRPAGPFCWSVARRFSHAARPSNQPELLTYPQLDGAITGGGLVGRAPCVHGDTSEYLPAEQLLQGW